MNSRTIPAPPAALARSRGWTSFALLAGALVGLAWGWHVFEFLCDDAYIGFRHVGNAMAGFGFTWNPPPFRPVEGYTSFLWELLLYAVWQIAGLDPTQCAAELGLLFAAGAVWHLWRMAQMLPLPERLARWRQLWVALVLLGTLSNRTFLAFASSGLEGALLTMLLLGWTSAVARRRYVSMSIHAALLPICRPDAVIAWGLTVAFLLHERPRVRPLVFLPLALVPLHFLWRRATYGFWLPNTFYAKSSEPFLEAGLRYAASWMLEYAWWFAAGVAVVAAVVLLRRKQRLELQPWMVAAAAMLATAGWYTIALGGDHFEYRIYVHFVPLSWLALLALLGALRASPRAAAAVMVTQLALSLPIPWVHWNATRDITAFRFAHVIEPVAPHFPALARPYAAAFDDLQAWLIRHLVCVRQQEHKLFAQRQLALAPPRRPSTSEVQAAWASPSDVAVATTGCVGVLGWMMPDVAIIDLLGLNDVVVARHPLLREQRRLAHERQPPEGYVECFRRNVALIDRRVIVEPREKPLTPAEIVEVEEFWWDHLALAPQL